MGLKGNSGKASRKKHLHRLTVVISLCLLIILAVELTGFRGSSGGEPEKSALRHANANANPHSAM
jgi:hypothetical protein